MKKLASSLTMTLVIVVCVACSGEDVSQKADTHTPYIPDQTQEYSQLISKTNPVPNDYEAEATQKGQVIRIDYDTRDYAEGTGRSRTNTAYVYLPYGYDDDTDVRYNALYFVHGHYGTAESFFVDENGLLRKLLDHMNENADMAPTIVVSPSYNYGNPTTNYADADPYCKALPIELINDLIPLIENKYRLESSRDHRAIGGFSMGSVTTWYAFEQTLADFKYYMPISADCWSLGRFAGMNRPNETALYLADIVRESGYKNDEFHIWAASGTSDSAYNETLVQVRAMSQLTDVFPLSNLTFHEKDGARHEFRPMAEYLYNALPFFFPNSTLKHTEL